jgi:hypothetical protein
MRIPVYSISIPEYKVGTKPDSEKIGAKVDKLIKKYFLGKRVAIRCLGSQEHKRKSAANLINIIKQLGYDRYDSQRKGDRYENVENKKIDFFAIDFNIKEKTKIMEKFIEPFYLYPPLIRGAKPIRLDIVIVYDLSKLRRVLHQYYGRRDIKRDGFVFKDPENKKDALLGIIKLK